MPIVFPGVARLLIFAKIRGLSDSVLLEEETLNPLVGTRLDHRDSNFMTLSGIHPGDSETDPWNSQIAFRGKIEKKPQECFFERGFIDRTRDREAHTHQKPAYHPLNFPSPNAQTRSLFTLKNPNNFPARRFALNPEEKDSAIFCGDTRCQDFNDIAVLDNCNANTHSYTLFGRSYTNDTGLDEKVVFTGSEYFKVKEIEVFEITD
jgi:hypothetical protein